MQSGALNESYADVFGALIDRGNWTIGEQIVKALKDFMQETAQGAFPAPEHCYKMPEPELRKLEELIKHRK